MEETKTRSNIVLWIILGCLGLIVVACVIGVILIASSIMIVNRAEAPSSFASTLVAPQVKSPPQVSQTPQEGQAPQVESPAQVESPPSVSQTPLIEAAQEVPATNTPIPENDESTQNDNDMGIIGSTEARDPYKDQRQEIESAVASIRGLEPITGVVPAFLSMEEVRQRLESDFLEDYGPDEAKSEAITLSAFDFIPADFDLHSFILDVLTEQIAGFYDPEKDEFVVRSDDEEFDSIEQIAHAHEFVHALQDQHFELEDLYDESLESEEAFAFRAFIEGEATFVQMLFLQSDYFSFEELAQLLMDMVGSLTVDMDVLASAPPVLASQLEFPYAAGLEFVQELYSRDGFQTVDDAWQNPPQSTEQILHPDRYFAGDEPQSVSLIPIDDVLGDGWEKIDEDALGEFYLREYLGQRLESPSVDLAAAGWGGDRYAVFFNDESQEIVLILRLAWDTPVDKDEFQDAYNSFADRRFGAAGELSAAGGRCWVGDDTICLLETNDHSLIVRAPDLALAETLAASQLP